MNIKLGLPLLGLVSLSSVLACSSSPSPSGASKTGVESSAIIAGTASDKSQDDVVLLIHFDPTQQAVAACSGTLLSDRVILTARHCVAQTDESAACDVTGAPLAGGTVSGNFPAGTLYAFVGQNRPDFNAGQVTPDGVGSIVLDDGGTNLCNHDIAMVILKDPIPNAKIAQIRLESSVTKGEVLTAVGWGVTDQTPEPAVRQQRSGIAVQAVGPDDSLQLAVAPNEFEVGESICSGDSGGPALDKTTNAIVGIVSRGGNGQQPTQNDPSVACVGANASNLYTKVAPFKSFIVKGLAMVGATPWEEGQPDPRLLVPDSPCTSNAQCGSNFCVADPSKSGALTCAIDCSTGTACPSGQTCATEGANQVCRVGSAGGSSGSSGTSGSGAAPGSTQIITKSGCATSPAGSAPASGAFALLLGALGFAAMRRRR